MALVLTSAIKSLTESTERTEKSKKLCDLCGLCERKKKGENYRDLQVADAAHVAFAEQAGASFITCDDKLAKKCLTSDIRVWTGSPIAFCEKENLK